MNGQKLLDNAIFYERRKNWKKAIFFYNDLFEHFNNETFDNLRKLAPEELKVLKFQCYHHCGVAYQKLRDHNTAIPTFQEAIRIVEKRKSGCSSESCVTGIGIHWSVPAHARKAFSQIAIGNLQEALQSSEKAVLLDNTNSDMYCIRAIVRFMLGDKDKAIEDTTLATKFNPQHVCSLILRGWFEDSLRTSALTRGMGGLHENNKWNKFEEMAYELNPSVVSCFGYPHSEEKIIEVFEKYLPTVRCPHTVTVYDVWQVARPRCEIPEKRSGNAKIEKTFSDSDTRLTRTTKTSLAANHSGIDASETNCRASLSHLDTRETEMPFATTHSKQDGFEAMIKDGGQVYECCKSCSSVEEFLKHLIWSEETNSEF